MTFLVNYLQITVITVPLETKMSEIVLTFTEPLWTTKAINFLGCNETPSQVVIIFSGTVITAVTVIGKVVCFL